jgi:hypothetical protein
VGSKTDSAVWRILEWVASTEVKALLGERHKESGLTLVLGSGECIVSAKGERLSVRPSICGDPAKVADVLSLQGPTTPLLVVLVEVEGRKQTRVDRTHQQLVNLAKCAESLLGNAEEALGRNRGTTRTRLRPVLVHTGGFAKADLGHLGGRQVTLRGEQVRVLTHKCRPRATVHLDQVLQSGP